jgi:hypothetical protein
MGAGFGVDAGVGDAETLDGTAVDEVLLNDLGCVLGLYAAVPDGFRVDDDGGAVLALVEAEGLVDAHAGEAGGLGELLKLVEDFALSIGGAGGAGCSLGTDVMTDKDVMLEKRQSVILQIQGTGCRVQGSGFRGQGSEDELRTKYRVSTGWGGGQGVSARIGR